MWLLWTTPRTRHVGHREEGGHAGRLEGGPGSPFFKGPLRAQWTGSLRAEDRREDSFPHSAVTGGTGRRSGLRTVDLERAGQAVGWGPAG